MRLLLLLASVLAASGGAVALGTSGSHWVGQGSGLDPAMPSGPFVGSGVSYGVFVGEDGRFGAGVWTNPASCWCGPTGADQKFNTQHWHSVELGGDPGRGADLHANAFGFLSDQPWTVLSSYQQATYARAGPQGAHTNSNGGVHVPPDVGPQVHTCVNASPDVPYGLGTHTTLDGTAPAPALGAFAGHCGWEGWG